MVGRSDADTMPQMAGHGQQQDVMISQWLLLVLSSKDALNRHRATDMRVCFLYGVLMPGLAARRNGPIPPPLAPKGSRRSS